MDHVGRLRVDQISVGRMIETMDLSKPEISLVKTSGNLHLPSNSRLLSEQDTNPGSLRRRTLFLDRDGVLVQDVHFLTQPDQLRVLPGVAEALITLQDRFFIVVATNQSGIARGLLTEEDLLAIHTVMTQELYRDGAIIDALYFCPHHPEANVAEYRTSCDCRKPLPGMFLKAASDWSLDLSQSVMVGDMPRDAEAAYAAGATPIMVGDQRLEVGPQTIVAADLLEASILINRQESHVPGDWAPLGPEATGLIQATPQKDDPS